MVEISSVNINANGTYSDYFQISETGATIFQGIPNPNSIITSPLPETGDLYICTSIPELFIYNGYEWTTIGESSSTFYTQDIVTSGVIIGAGLSFSGFLYATVNINSSSTLILPTPVTTGTTIIVKDISGLAGTNTISISTQNSSMIDGQSSVAIDINYGCYTFLYTGTYWTIISAMSSFPLNTIMLGGGIANGYTLPTETAYSSYVSNYVSRQFIPGTITSGQLLATINVVENIEFLPDFAGSVANCLIPPQSDVVIDIVINDVSVGTLIYSGFVTIGTFVSPAKIITNPGDVIEFSVTTSDPNISGIFFTLSGSALYSPIAFTNYITVTSSLQTLYNGVSFSIQGNVFPGTSLIQFGYSASNTVPPTIWSETVSSKGQWSGNISIPVDGNLYLWTQIANTTVQTITAITVDSSSVTITDTNNYYANIPSNISGTVAPPNAGVQVGYSSSSSTPPDTWITATVSFGNWSASLSIPPIIGLFYLWAQLVDDTTISTNIETTVSTSPLALVDPITQAYIGDSIQDMALDNGNLCDYLGYLTSSTTPPNSDDEYWYPCYPITLGADSIGAGAWCVNETDYNNDTTTSTTPGTYYQWIRLDSQPNVTAYYPIVLSAVPTGATYISDYTAVNFPAAIDDIQGVYNILSATQGGWYTDIFFSSIGAPDDLLAYAYFTNSIVTSQPSSGGIVMQVGAFNEGTFYIDAYNNTNPSTPGTVYFSVWATSASDPSFNLGVYWSDPITITA